MLDEEFCGYGRRFFRVDLSAQPGMAVPPRAGLPTGSGQLPPGSTKAMIFGKGAAVLRPLHDPVMVISKVLMRRGDIR